MVVVFRRATFAAVGSLAVVSVVPCARAEFASWSNTSTAGIGTATVSFAGLSAGPQLALSPFDLTTPSYSPAGSANQQALNYLCLDDWSASFSKPLTNFNLYLIFWRGEEGGADPVQYTFNRAFSIKSGLIGASVAGNTLNLPAGALYEGVLQFNGTFSSLSVASNASIDNAQAITFNASVAPEPGALAVLALGATVFLRRRK